MVEASFWKHQHTGSSKRSVSAEAFIVGSFLSFHCLLSCFWSITLLTLVYFRNLEEKLLVSLIFSYGSVSHDLYSLYMCLARAWQTLLVSRLMSYKKCPKYSVYCTYHAEGENYKHRIYSLHSDMKYKVHTVIWFPWAGYRANHLILTVLY